MSVYNAGDTASNYAITSAYVLAEQDGSMPVLQRFREFKNNLSSSHMGMADDDTWLTASVTRTDYRCVDMQHKPSPPTGHRRSNQIPASA